MDLREVFGQSLDVLDEAVERLRAELDGLERAVAHTRDALAQGMPMKDLYPVSDAPRSRDAVIEAINSLQSVLMRSRGQYIRILVDDEGMTISAASRLIGHPRQLVKRQYDAAVATSSSLRPA